VTVQIECPTCQKHHWRTAQDIKDFRQNVLLCVSCGFSVDMRVVRRFRSLYGRLEDVATIAEDEATEAQSGPDVAA
jgi:transcription elongation factor Elf1